MMNYCSVPGGKLEIRFSLRVGNSERTEETPPDADRRDRYSIPTQWSRPIGIILHSIYWVRKSFARALR